MSAAVVSPPPVATPGTGRRPAAFPAHASHIVLPSVSWEAYLTIGELFRDQPILLTYDHGDLEIMTISLRHEGGKSLLLSLLTMLFFELKIKVVSGGNMTFRREDVESGIEPDACYWVQQAAAMRGKEEFDGEQDPPPDLAIEVEVSRTVLNRLKILAALKVPEVWRTDGRSVQVLLLSEAGQYDAVSQSKALPFLPVPELSRFLGMRPQRDELDIQEAFVAWVRLERAGWGV